MYLKVESAFEKVGNQSLISVHLLAVPAGVGDHDASIPYIIGIPSRLDSEPFWNRFTISTHSAAAQHTANGVIPHDLRREAFAIQLRHLPDLQFSSKLIRPIKSPILAEIGRVGSLYFMLPLLVSPVLESMAVADLSDVELIELLSEKIAGVPTRILEVPFAYEYSPELLTHWMENVPYYYCYTDKSEVSTGNRYVRKEYDGIWKKSESEVIIRDEASKLLGFKVCKIHCRKQRTTGWIL
nr:NAC domain-containing protein 7-like [Ipomoea batatas]